MMNNFLDIEKFEETLNDASRHNEIEYGGLDITTTNLKSLKPDEVAKTFLDKTDVGKLIKSGAKWYWY